MQSFGAPRPTTNPYIVMLQDALRRTPDVEHLPFSWRTAIFGRYDVFHVHWGDTLLAAGSRRTRAGKRAAMAVLLARLALTRTPVVRTVHNITPPEGGRIDVTLLTALERLTTLRIRLSPTTPEVAGIRSALILHGHYRDWFAPMSKSAATPDRLAYVGLIKPYKGVEQLLVAFEELSADRGEIRLTVAGRASDPDLARTITEAADRLPALEADLRYLSEEEFVAIVSAASAVVLPYRHMHNSGSALAALSLDRPILVPDNETTRLLAAEVGTEWVHFFGDELTAGALARLADATAGGMSGRPDLSAREWDAAGAAHADAYRDALGAVRRRRSALPDPEGT
ncbi:glycosyltransferase [Microbacterium sp. SSM24]|uniref:glycosyltransferase n=1 Tax=Microbacterium sp. SSM24 TaxID=2991714 RepID=UPI00222723D1|nr:glycosyltransferase [Microbacterium sp. SSM24]MCW3492779.1 glycosyl transferase [Microbacterium sp. SSM24]